MINGRAVKKLRSAAQQAEDANCHLLSSFLDDLADASIADEFKTVEDVLHWVADHIQA